MKKRIILIISLIIVATVALTSCDMLPDFVKDIIGNIGHTHEFGEWTVETEATCTEDGLKYRVCECEERETEVIPSSGHSIAEWIIDSEATCTEAGSKHGVCSGCGDTVNETILALGHTSGEWIIDSEASCGEAGARHTVCTACGITMASEEIPVLEHGFDKYYFDENNHYFKCPNCGETKDTAEHDFGESDTCSICTFVKYTMGVRYEVSPDRTHAMVTGYYNSENPTTISIRPTYNGYPVTTISGNAFYYKSGFERVILPDSITHIEDQAFAGCSTLKDIVLPESLTYIGYGAFSYDEKIERIVMPNSVTYIGSGAFRDCKALSDIVFSENLTEIGGGAFSGTAFYEDESNWENGELYVGTYLLGINDEVGIDYEVKEGTTLIADQALAGADIISVIIPESVEYMTSGSIASEFLMDIYNFSKVDSSTLEYDNVYQGGIHDSLDATPYAIRVNGLIFGMQYDTMCWLIKYVGDDTDIVIPDGINDKEIYIRKYAFQDRTDITSVDFGNSVLVVYEYAFKGCSSLKDVTLNNTTAICESAFADCTSLESLTVTGSGATIHTKAFSNCPNLKSISLADGNVQIYQDAFTTSGYYLDEANWDNGILYISNHLIKAKDTVSGNIVIRPGTVTVADEAFYYNKNITGVSFPNSLLRIGAYSFAYTSKLSSISLNEGLATIYDDAFCSCSELETVVIPNSVKYIGPYSFDEYNIKHVTGPSHVFTYNSGLAGKYLESAVITKGNIADNTFTRAKNLASITIMNEVQSIGLNAFTNTAYYLDEANWENGVLYIGDCLIKAKTDISGAYQIKDGTRIIANYAFSECVSLESISFPEGLIRIGDNAFSKCSAITELVLPDSLEYVGSCSFSGCNALESISVPFVGQAPNMTETNNPNYKKFEYLFQGHYYHSSGYGKVPENLKTVIVRGGVIHDEAFECCKNVLNIILEDGVEYIGDKAFCGAKSLEKITIPNTVTHIGESAFSGCPITEVVIGSGITEISDSVFSGCTSLSSIVIPDNVTKIGNAAFRGCLALETIVISDNVTTIGSDAFNNCQAIEKITMPLSLEFVGENAFYDCDALVNVVIKSIANWCGVEFANGLSNPLYGIEDVFYDYHPKASLYLLSGTEELLVEDLVIPSGVTSLGEYVFMGCTSIKSISFPDTLTAIGACAFEGCISLTSVVVPEQITDFGRGSNFSRCTNLESVVILSDVTKIADGMFYECRNMTSVVIPATVTEVGNGAFKDCQSLVSIYYGGKNETEWNKINIDNSIYGWNYPLIDKYDVVRYYYSATEPTGEGNFWHYVGTTPTVWE